jgi:pre-rRNA-processing protein TSR1
MLAALDGCKVADFVLFVLSAKEEVDPFGESMIRSIEAQGVSTTHIVVQHLETIEPVKKRPDVKKSLLSYISHFFPTTAKIHETEGSQEAPNLIRSLCTSTPKGVHWRDDRPYIVAEEVRYEDEKLIVGGVVRGRGLKADRLVHIQGFGDFQIDKICAYPSARRTHGDEMAVDEEASDLHILEIPTEDQEDLTELASEEDVMLDIPDNVSEVPTAISESRKGVLLDDHHYFDDDINELNEAYEMPKKLPKGTSKYQSAWYIDGENYGSDVDSDATEDDIDMDAEDPCPEDGMEGLAGPAATEAGTVYGDDAKSEMFLDPSPEQELAEIKAFRDRAKELEEEREFPDEIELHPNVLARERLARYRGLKSLRTSKWETSEDRPWQPKDWDRLAQIQNYRGTKNHMINEAMVGGVQPGTRVLVYLRADSPDVAQAYRPERPFILWGLLQHEHKQSVVNVSITASTDYAGEPIKAKDELILQIGPRRLHVNPLFSTGGGVGPNNVAKFERFLIPGRTSVAAFLGPITWGSVPVVAWKRGDDERDWELVGQGSFLGVDRERIVAKRIVITGHPYKIHKKLVTVRYMFFNAGKSSSVDISYLNSLLMQIQMTSIGSRPSPCTLGVEGVGSSRRV